MELVRVQGQTNAMGMSHGSSHGRSGSFDAESSVFVNEANFPNLQTSMNNQHLQQGHGLSSTGHPSAASAHNNLNALIARVNDKQVSQRMDPSHHHHNNHRTGPVTLQIPEFISGTAATHRRDQANNDLNTSSCTHEETSTEEAMGGLGGYQWFTSPPASCPLLGSQAYFSLETENGEDRGEENIVYL
ncbi:hypothetical protein JZ751_001765 [Albula glossodonta]|uniref:Uncharacterized protein n=1 Tax=Albula glossodonta TaxID=121402 RepID=A0A8T2PUA4_9TELE|nr:hypothetical protein JZ751_001765 [Albula glossodonta]